VNVSNEEGASEWVTSFQSWSKTTMSQTKGYGVTGKRVLFREMRHCIHSSKVKDKQGNRETKHPYSSRVRNICCNATIHIRLERRRVAFSHPLEINIKYTHNHVINSAESLSFRRVKEEVHDEYLKLFKDGHTPASALHTYEDGLYLQAANEDELLELLADRAENPDYGYVVNLFRQFRETELGGRNGNSMFDRLEIVVEDYNNSGFGKAALQKYDAHTGRPFILCIVTNLMSRVHEKIIQAGTLSIQLLEKGFFIGLIYLAYSLV
jgi:hypothetical protein